VWFSSDNAKGQTAARLGETKMKRPQFSLKTLLLIVFLAAVACTVFLNWEYIPGTFYLDQYRNPHGTGWDTQYYNSGAPMVKSYYRAGELREKFWYKPDGSIAASTQFHRDGANLSYDLRQDGTVESRFECKYFYEEGFHRYFADGTFTHLRPDGSVERLEEYRNGVPTNLSTK
jgi:hypothetical protein